VLIFVPRFKRPARFLWKNESSSTILLDVTFTRELRDELIKSGEGVGRAIALSPSALRREPSDAGSPQEAFRRENQTKQPYKDASLP